MIIKAIGVPVHRAVLVQIKDQASWRGESMAELAGNLGKSEVVTVVVDSSAAGKLA